MPYGNGMKNLLELHDKDVGLQAEAVVKYTSRTAARAVLRKGDAIALLHVKNHHYYKLPGGGVDQGETVKEGLQRELLEEVGCTFKILQEMGKIVEYRSQIELVQTSYCYLAEGVGEGKPHFTEEEIEGGFTLVWATFDKAIELLKKSRPDTYDGKFIVKRDLRFLQEAKKYF